MFWGQSDSLNSKPSKCKSNVFQVQNSETKRVNLIKTLYLKVIHSKQWVMKVLILKSWSQSYTSYITVSEVSLKATMSFLPVRFPVIDWVLGIQFSLYDHVCSLVPHKVLSRLGEQYQSIKFINNLRFMKQFKKGPSSFLDRTKDKNNIYLKVYVFMIWIL